MFRLSQKLNALLQHSLYASEELAYSVRETQTAFYRQATSENIKQVNSTPSKGIKIP